MSIDSQTARQFEQVKIEPCSRILNTNEELLALYEGTELGEFMENFVAFIAKVETLRAFVMLNLQAVVKITKKHDKHSDTSLQGALVQQVHNRNFFKSQRFGTLMTDIDALAMQLVGRISGMTISGKLDKGQCPTCMKTLCNPITLPCMHRFCMKCVSPASYFRRGYCCPVCQQVLAPVPYTAPCLCVYGTCRGVHVSI
jgi:hypothetical protein